MVDFQEFYFDSRDKKTKIHAVKWIPGGTIRGILVIAHGKEEHILRYDEFGRYMAEQGILTAGCDHLGHGRTAATPEDFGYFCEEDGDIVVVRDVHRLKKLVQDEYPGVPVFVLGHSMGSFIIRNYICSYGKGISGALLIGTGTMSSLMLKLGRLYLKFRAAMVGWKSRDVGMSLPTDGYLKRIENPKTESAWLSTWDKSNEAFDNDPLCSCGFTLNGYDVLAKLMLKAGDQNYIAKIPKDLPVYLMSGTEDPVGDYGVGVRKVYEMYQKAGLRRVSLKMYEGDRHEILNEQDRYAVYEEILRWMKEIAL